MTAVDAGPCGQACNMNDECFHVTVYSDQMVWSFDARREGSLSSRLRHLPRIANRYDGMLHPSGWSEGPAW
jgi:hypothetical protein